MHMFHETVLLMESIKSLLSSYYGVLVRTIARRLRYKSTTHDGAHTAHSRSTRPAGEWPAGGAGRRLVVCDVEGGLLRSASTFPYFMLVAFEAGGMLRALLLLLLHPLLCVLSEEAGTRVMAMVCFRGVPAEGFRVGRAVLPKHLLEDVGVEGFEMLTGGGGGAGGRKVCVSRMPRVMVEGALKEYLGVDVVVARELEVAGGYYTGALMEDDDWVKEALAPELSGEDGERSVAFGCFKKFSALHPVFSLCKELYEVSEGDRRWWRPLPRQKYPNPLVFHDGRLAFRPTPAATLVMFLWLPVAIPLACFRLVVALSLPYKLSTVIEAMTGVRWHLRGALPPPPPRDSTRKGRLFACNHRTLADPIYISIALDKPVTAVTYSLSKLSEWVSLIKTARLSKSKEEDRELMEKLLRKGDLVVCPEGTTCREPYLLRFSPLFTELCDEVVPVAVEVKVDMFHATTARGFKGLDTFYFLMNPWTRYEMEFLERIQTCSVREGRCSGIDMANRVQAVVGRALGFDCTSLTRKDKYLMLAGNEGMVKSSSRARLN